MQCQQPSMQLSAQWTKAKLYDKLIPNLQGSFGGKITVVSKINS